MKIYLLTMIVNHFPKIVKHILKRLPKNDYPVLNSRLASRVLVSLYTG
jgi:hypothetical protein